MLVGLDVNGFKTLYDDLDTCKLVVERVLSRKFSRPRDWSKYCLEVLVCTSRLYLDSLIFGQALKNTPARGNALNNPNEKAHPPRSSVRELSFRKRSSRKVESLPCWEAFEPANTFVDENQLRTRADYLFNLTLHLPEIYGEIDNLTAIVQARLETDGFSGADCWNLITGLEHAAHHASYCRHTLEVLSNELSWR